MYLGASDKQKIIEICKRNDISYCALFVSFARGDATEEDNPQVEWQLATSARNRLIHGYFDVDPDVVWDIVENDLPLLKSQIEE